MILQKTAKFTNYGNNRGKRFLHRKNGNNRKAFFNPLAVNRVSFRNRRKSTKKLNKMAKFKKEVVYTMPYQTEKEIAAAAKRSKLYDKFNSVQVYPNGLYEVRIVASN